MCVCLCLSWCLSGWFNYEGLVPHKPYFAVILLGMSSCASYVSRTHGVIDDVTRSQSRSNFEIDISPSIFELERRKAQNIGNANGYLSGIFNFRYNFRQYVITNTRQACYGVEAIPDAFQRLANTASWLCGFDLLGEKRALMGYQRADTRLHSVQQVTHWGALTQWC